MTGEIKELRLRYSAEGMAHLIGLIDAMKLGALPAPIAVFLTVASDITNWHPVEEA